MLRMMKMELAVLKKYLKQITFTMLIVERDLSRVFFFLKYSILF